MNKKKGTSGFTTVIILIVIIALGFYTYLSNRAGQNEKNVEASPTEKLLSYDFEKDYPKTVRETVKLHCTYLKYAYNGSFTEDELFTVNKNIRQLFDEELLKVNTEDGQLQGLKDDIKLYEDKKQRFVSFSLAEGSQVQYNTENNIEYAKMKVTLALNIDSSAVSVEEDYILRKNSDGKWKILGWQMRNNASSDNKKSEGKGEKDK